MLRLPLEGVRILELAHAIAVPRATKQLVSMGAEVIKIESCAHPDIARRGPHPDNDPGEKYWNRGGRYNDHNRNKIGITLDLNKPQGVQIFKELVRISDVVVESFTPRVMKNFGLDYPVLKELKSDIIMLSSSGFGHTGPWRDYPAWGLTLEPTAGFSHLTGYLDGLPVKSGAYTDYLTAFHAAFAVLAALEYRRRTGKGQWIDLSHYELSVCLVGEAIMDYTMNQRVQTRIGNRHPFMAPHGCYRCKGDDKWVVIAVSSEEQWLSLCDALGNPPWTREKRFSDALSRWHHQDELDKLLEAWTSLWDHYEVMHTLQRAGVPAGAALDSKELLLDPHLKERDAFDLVNHPEHTGTGRRYHLSTPWKMSKTQVRLVKPAPTLGQDNERILRGLLGMSKEEIDELTREGVIGTELTAKGFRLESPPPSVMLQERRIAGYDTNFEEILGLE